MLGRIFGVVGASGAAEYVDTLTPAGAENVAFEAAMRRVFNRLGERLDNEVTRRVGPPIGLAEDSGTKEAVREFLRRPLSVKAVRGRIGFHLGPLAPGLSPHDLERVVEAFLGLLEEEVLNIPGIRERLNAAALLEIRRLNSQHLGVASE